MLRKDPQPRILAPEKSPFKAKERLGKKTEGVRCQATCLALEGQGDDTSETQIHIKKGKQQQWASEGKQGIFLILYLQTTVCSKQ